MEFKITVPALLTKLWKLLGDDVITSPKFRDQVVQLINTIDSFQLISEDDDEDIGLILGGLLNDAVDIIDEFILTTEVQRRKCTNQLLSLLNQRYYTHQLECQTHQLESNISHLNRVLERSQGLSNRRLIPTSPNVNRTDQIVTTGHTMQWENIPGYLDEASYMVGREEDIAYLMKRLLDYEDMTWNSRVIPVVGAAGSGKTTLVRKIYNRVDIKQHFECRAWVHVSTELQERNILVDIAKQVMVMIKEHRLSNEELKFRLRTFLQNKRYLIVLDGVRTTDVWSSLRLALPDTENGSNIILTTVDAHVAHQANPGSLPFEPRLLTDKESWELFLNKVKVSQDDSRMPDFIRLREQILRTCNGVPLAILLLGGLFSTINLIQWSSVIEHAPLGECQSTVSVVLAVSYQGLPYKLKSCLLYMCLFPREYEIPIRRLFGLWISEDMLTPSPMEGRVVEDVAQIYFSELVGRNLIEVAKWRSDGRPKACRMPGIIYDFFLPKALEMRFLCTQNSISSKAKRCANYLGMEMYYSNQDIDQSLRSYVSSDSGKRNMHAVGTGKFLIQITGKRCYGLLMVLDLEGVYKPVLDKALGKLLLLRYLGLRSTVLDSLPASVGELQGLETLDVKHTNITNLPGSILKGKQLRHLYLNGINLYMSKEQQSSGSTGDLQTLSGISVDSEDSIRDGLARFTGLRKLGLTCHPTAMRAVVNWISQLTNLRTLKLRSVDTFGQPSDVILEPMREHQELSDLYLLGVLPANLHELPQNLKILTLSLSRLEDDPMPTLGLLCHLKTLRLLAHSYRGKRMICNPESFPQLRILKLWMLEKLEEWVIEEGAMPCLRELEIRCCKTLKKSDGLEHLTTLKELILTNMPVDFVEDLERTMRKDHVFININNWEFSPLAWLTIAHED